MKCFIGVTWIHSLQWHNIKWLPVWSGLRYAINEPAQPNHRFAVSCMAQSGAENCYSSILLFVCLFPFVSRSFFISLYLSSSDRLQWLQLRQYSLYDMSWTTRIRFQARVPLVSRLWMRGAVPPLAVSLHGLVLKRQVYTVTYYPSIQMFPSSIPTVATNIHIKMIITNMSV